eukprot:TRINITY_DN8053_c0_g2_i1.p1 TRINITY_DN8053_c0_g2~~TRINITY_DN8053_c0_g2_i1.p1  ORF type:complete len:575 (+),score=220.49 TRINITY_DN8053_c0_g2_i1:99-1823(+)
MPGLRGHILAFFSKHSDTAGNLVLFAGVVYTLLLPVCFTRGTYFSENNLMAGYAKIYFGSAADLALVGEWAGALRQLSGGSKLRWGIQQRLKEHGIESWEQPLPGGGVNVIATVPSHRGSGQAAALLTAPCDQAESTALLMAMGAHYRSAAYYNIDVHLLFACGTDQRTALGHFVDLLHAAPESSPKLSISTIFAAVSLDFRSFKAVTLIKIGTLGADGMQPNMDLVNTVDRLCRQHETPCTVYPEAVGMAPAPDWVHSAAQVLLLALRAVGAPVRARSGAWLVRDVRTFWGYLLLAVSGDATVPHSPLRAAGIHAVTLAAYPLPPELSGTPPPVAQSYRRVGQVIEGTLRAINNLSERLHQSFWIYFYTNDLEFVDYDKAQPQCWLFIAVIIISSFRGGVGSQLAELAPGVGPALLCGLAGAAAYVAHQLLDTVSCAGAALGAAAVLPVLWGAFGRGRRQALGAQRLWSIAAAAALAGCTVQCTALAVTGSIAAAFTATAVAAGARASLPLRALSLAVVALLSPAALARAAETYAGGLGPQATAYALLVAAPYSAAAAAVLTSPPPPAAVPPQ